MGKFRENETDEFPISFNISAYWYIIIKGTKNKPELIQYSNSKEQSRKLVEHLETNFRKTKDILLGSWTGKWITDLFILDPKVMIKRIKEILEG